MIPHKFYERLSAAFPAAICQNRKRGSPMTEPATPPVRYLTLEIERNGDLTTVRCHGQLVSGLTETLYNRVKPLIPESKRIVLDLCHLTYMDSMGLGTLMS